MGLLTTRVELLQPAHGFQRQGTEGRLNWEEREEIVQDYCLHQLQSYGER